MSEERDRLINIKIEANFDAYLKAYRKHIAVDEQPDNEVKAALRKRLEQRLNSRHDELDVIQAIEDETNILTLLDSKPHVREEKKKKSLGERFFKQTLKIATDNDMSGYAARKAPTTHTIEEVSSVAPVENALDHVATDYAAIGIQGFNLLTVPLLYLYYYAKGEPVPFTLKNNMKMGLAAVGLTLAAVSIAFPPAAMAIALTMGSISLGISIYAFVKNIKERAHLKENMKNVKAVIEHLSEEIKNENIIAKQQKENIRAELQSQHPNIHNLKKYEDKLRECNNNLTTKHQALRAAVKDRSALRVDKTGGKTFFSALSTSTKALLVGGFIAGTILLASPATAPIGFALMMTTLGVGIALYAANKIANARAKKLEREYTETKLEELHEKTLSEEPKNKKEPSSIKQITATLGVNPAETEAPKIENAKPDREPLVNKITPPIKSAPIPTPSQTPRKSGR